MSDLIPLVLLDPIGLFVIIGATAFATWLVEVLFMVETTKFLATEFCVTILLVVFAAIVDTVLVCCVVGVNDGKGGGGGNNSSKGPPVFT